MSTSFRFQTDTSTLCVFDVAAMRHRIDEDADWWVYPPGVQVEELNSAAAAFIDLGADGTYSGTLSEAQLASPAFSFVLSCPSGKLFLGAAEETTAEGMEPDCSRGGLLLTIRPGVYQLSVSRPSSRMLQIGLLPSTAQPSNAFTAPLRLASNAA